MNLSKEEIEAAALEAYPVDMFYGGNQPSYDQNLYNRIAFKKGFEFRQWLIDATMTQTDIPLHIKYRMFKNQRQRLNG